MKLRILHTNDIHSNFEHFYQIADELERQKDGAALILDAGDFADFKRIELQGTDGLAAMRLLDAAGYDALAVGNNETFQGLDILSYMAQNSKVDFVSCNLKNLEDEDIPGVNRSVILNKDGLRILVIGTSPDLGPFNELLGFSLIEEEAAIRKEMEAAKGQYDICILLSHLGMDKDRELAEQIAGIHVIIGGHFHILMDKPEVVNQTIIHTSGDQGRYLGKLVLEIEDESVRLVSGENIPVTSSSSSQSMAQLLEENRAEAIERLSVPFCQIRKSLWHDLVEENPMSNLLADALTDVFDCDFGIINSGVLNGGIKAGDVSRKKIIELCPSPLNPTLFEIQGKDIQKALEESLDSNRCYEDGKGPGFRGKYLGRLHVSKVRIYHDGVKIQKVLIRDMPLEPERWYRVASSDYLQRGTGYASLEHNRDEVYRKEYLRDIIEDYVKIETHVDHAMEDRWILC